jgi:L-fuconolactonase
MTMVLTVDSHQHFWDTTSGRFDYYWMSAEFDAIKGLRGPEQLRPLIAAAGIERTVSVQAIGSLEETIFLLETAQATDFVAGVVGWVDLTDPAVGETIAALRSRPDGRWLRSIRHQVHDEEDADWLLRPDVRVGLKAVEEAGLAYDILVRSRELPAALATVRDFPNSRFVVDHIAKPNIKAGEVEPWVSRMRPLADHPNVVVKVSGMITEADWVTWRPDDLRPYVQRLLEWFGPRRLMFGSDWPVCTVAGSYAQVHEAATVALGDLSDDDRSWVFGRTATVAYQLDEAG